MSCCRFSQKDDIAASRLATYFIHLFGYNSAASKYADDNTQKSFSPSKTSISYEYGWNWFVPNKLTFLNLYFIFIL